MKYSIAATIRTGKPSFLGKLAQDKATLRAETARMVRAYERNGGLVTVCRPGVAQGASFTRNKSPFNNLRGVPAE